MAKTGANRRPDKTRQRRHPANFRRITFQPKSLTLPFHLVIS
ncbi:hypothetical protein HMPREF3220_04487 [Citrobacter koseri]|nr:hypothetical protein HMPREF3220_04487 [Citrobacter koseri]